MKKFSESTLHQSHQSAGPFSQSASLLAENYGLTLDPVLLAADSFYALTELFQISASSISQLINLVESIIDQNTGYNLLKSKDYSLANLSYHEDILNRLKTRLRENIFDLECHEDPAWPRSYDFDDDVAAEKRAQAIACAGLLLADFKHLLSRAEHLSSRCQSGMTVCMNSASIAESQRAIAQAQQVEQLTRLAFFYIPLSFTTSFFGMNLGIFGSGHLPLWLWFAVSVPLTFFSYVILACLSGKLKPRIRLNLR